jgi:hypothetical protein
MSQEFILLKGFQTSARVLQRDAGMNETSWEIDEIFHLIKILKGFEFMRLNDVTKIKFEGFL